MKERFYRVDKARGSSGARSLGLGLAIAQEIVSAHGGTMSIASRPGSGTTVDVTIPAPPSFDTATTKWPPWTRPRAAAMSAGQTHAAADGAAARSDNGSGRLSPPAEDAAERRY